MVPLGVRLLTIRKVRQLTQKVLAQEAGVAERTISLIENGVTKAPRRDTLSKIEAALSLPLVNDQETDAAFNLLANGKPSDHILTRKLEFGG